MRTHTTVCRCRRFWGPTTATTTATAAGATARAITAAIGRESAVTIGGVRRFPLGYCIHLAVTTANVDCAVDDRWRSRHRPVRGEVRQLHAGIGIQRVHVPVVAPNKHGTIDHGQRRLDGPTSGKLPLFRARAGIQCGNGAVVASHEGGALNNRRRRGVGPWRRMSGSIEWA